MDIKGHLTDMVRKYMTLDSAILKNGRHFEILRGSSFNMIKYILKNAQSDNNVCMKI